MILWIALLISIPLLTFYLLERTRHFRLKQYASNPHLPPSLVCGHIKALDGVMGQGARRRHIDQVFLEINAKLNNPPLFVVDLRPVLYSICVIRSHKVTERVSHASKTFPYSLPKGDVLDNFAPLIGKGSIIFAQRFNPGFAPRHLISLLPGIMNRVQRFVDILDAHAVSGEFKPGTKIQRRRLSKQLDYLLQQRVRVTNEKKKPRSVLTLSFKGEAEAGGLNNNDLSQEFLSQTCNQLKPFLFTGYNTTIRLLQWAFYKLSRAPHALATDRHELDKIMGPNPNPIVIQGMLLLSRAKSMLSNSLCESIIQREERRWLDKTDVADTKAPPSDCGTGRIPPSAWRPFERGPRNCIGQKLANLEAKIVLVCMLRRFDFVKVGLGRFTWDSAGEPVRGGVGQNVVEEELFNVTGKLVDGTQMRVLFA
ncbi:cytochrome P450 [Aspergillus pseudoustus]|uniref:Cytochrome P450 n=1 Tax=Aspergillus pseudoustus TaxID=1810923 RepID=A0ABR4JBB6_9EURO